MKKKYAYFIALLLLTALLFSSACSKKGTFDKTPVDKLSWGMDTDKVIRLLGEADEVTESGSYETSLHYTHGVKTVFGSSDDLYIFISHEKKGGDGSEFGLYRISGRIPDIDTEVLDGKVKALYGSWDGIVHDEEAELVPERAEKGYVRYDYIYEAERIKNLQLKEREALLSDYEALRKENSADHKADDIELVRERSLVNVTAAGTEEKGVLFTVDAFFYRELQRLQ